MVLVSALSSLSTSQSDSQWLCNDVPVPQVQTRSRWSDLLSVSGLRRLTLSDGNGGVAVCWWESHSALSNSHVSPVITQTSPSSAPATEYFQIKQHGASWWKMSAKSLIRYRNTVGGNDPLSTTSPQLWSSDKDSVKKSSMRDSGSVSETSSNNRLEEDSFDEGIDDILAQVRTGVHVKTFSRLCS